MNQVKLMYQASLAIQTLKADKELMKQLSQHGHDARRMKEGEKLLEEAQNIMVMHDEAKRQAREATLSLRETRQHVQERYMRHLSIARIAFRDELAARDALGLSGPRKRTLDQWLKQTEDFYRNSAPHVGVLQAHGVPLHELDEIRILVGQMIELAALQKQAQSRTQVLTQRKQEQIVLLRNWYGRLIRLARLALEDNPQQLEAFGIVVKS